MGLQRFTVHNGIPRVHIGTYYTGIAGYFAKVERFRRKKRLLLEISPFRGIPICHRPLEGPELNLECEYSGMDNMLCHILTR